MQPVEITRKDNELFIIWDDGFSSSIALEDLRKNCPCALCRGEEIGTKKTKPIKLDVFKPGVFEIDKIEPIGNYAINIIWKDGHDTGIYSFEFLRFLTETFSKTAEI